MKNLLNELNLRSPQSESEWRFAEALAVLKSKSNDPAAAQIYVAERIGALALSGDEAGVERWREIAKAMDEILRPNGIA